jgi:demethylmenaquinone methyltransferase/2-methoxy-6-polyprenyl-1,4-benzoquinol methylase
MILNIGRWQLSIKQLHFDTEALMSAYSERASGWQRTIRRFGMERSYRKLWVNLPIRFKEKSRVLDMGAGTGALAESFKMSYPLSDITLLDLNEQMLEQAHENLRFTVKLVHANAVTYQPRDGRFDILMCAHLIEHLDCPSKVFEGWKACLDEDSYVVLVVTRNTWYNRLLQFNWNLNIFRHSLIEKEFKKSGYTICHSDKMPDFLASRLSQVFVAKYEGRHNAHADHR